MNFDATSNAELVERLGQHDRWLRSVLYARLQCPEAVDEVMQEVAVATVKQQSREEAIERFGPWLYRVALKQVCLYRRKIGRRRKLMDAFATHQTVVDPLQAGPQRDSLDWLVHRERTEQVRTALDELCSRDREILLLKYSDNLSYHEIAERTGMSFRAVQSRLHRARGRLRDALLDRHPE